MDVPWFSIPLNNAKLLFTIVWIKENTNLRLIENTKQEINIYYNRSVQICLDPNILVFIGFICPIGLIRPIGLTCILTVPTFKCVVLYNSSLVIQ